MKIKKILKNKKVIINILIQLDFHNKKKILLKS